MAAALPRDITEEFFRLCNDLNDNEFVLNDITLLDSVNAAELMEPKADYGMIRNQNRTTVESLRAEGYFDPNNMSLPEMLAIVDASFACLAAYATGSPMGTTVYTNLLFRKPILLGVNPVMNCLTAAFSLVIPLTRAVILTAGLYSPEDFNEAMSFKYPRHSSYDQLWTTFDHVDEWLTNTDGLSECAATVCLILRSRFYWLRAFIEGCHLVMPGLAPGDKERLDHMPFPFLPTTTLAKVMAKKMCQFADHFAGTNYGAKNGDGPGWEKRDGDFSWLKLFVPSVNQEYMDCAFPPNNSILNRLEAMEYWKDFSYRFDRIVREARVETRCVEDIFRYFADRHGNNLFLRSIQQIFIRSIDQESPLILGYLSLNEVVMNSLLVQTRSFCLVDQAILEEHRYFKNNRDAFVGDISEHVRSLILVLGKSPSRQRTSLPALATELWRKNEAAEELDYCINQVTGEEDRLKTVGGWLEFLVAIVMERYFELTLSFNLPGEEEFPSFYWIFADNILEPMAIYFSSYYAMLLNEDRDRQLPPIFAIRDENLNSAMNNLYTTICKMNMCRAMYFTSLAMIKSGFAKIHKWDEHSAQRNFEYRLREMTELPLFMNYKEYLEASCQNGYLATDALPLWIKGKRLFAEAEATLVRLLGAATASPPQFGPLLSDALEKLKTICKRNSFAIDLHLKYKRALSWKHEGDVFPTLAVANFSC